MVKQQSFVQWLKANPPVQPYIFDTERLKEAMISYLSKHPQEAPANRADVRTLAIKLGYTDYTGGCLWGAFRKANHD